MQKPRRSGKLPRKHSKNATHGRLSATRCMEMRSVKREGHELVALMKKQGLELEYLCKRLGGGKRYRTEPTGFSAMNGAGIHQSSCHECFLCT